MKFLGARIFEGREASLIINHSTLMLSRITIWIHEFLTEFLPLRGASNSINSEYNAYGETRCLGGGLCSGVDLS